MGLTILSNIDCTWRWVSICSYLIYFLRLEVRPDLFSLDKVVGSGDSGFASWHHFCLPWAFLAFLAGGRPISDSVLHWTWSKNRVKIAPQLENNMLRIVDYHKVTVVLLNASLTLWISIYTCTIRVRISYPKVVIIVEAINQFHEYFPHLLFYEWRSIKNPRYIK